MMKPQMIAITTPTVICQRMAALNFRATRKVLVVGINSCIGEESEKFEFLPKPFHDSGKKFSSNTLHINSKFLEL